MNTISSLVRKQRFNIHVLKEVISGIRGPACAVAIFSYTYSYIQREQIIIFLTSLLYMYKFCWCIDSSYSFPDFFNFQWFYTLISDSWKQRVINNSTLIQVNYNLNIHFIIYILFISNLEWNYDFLLIKDATYKSKFISVKTSILTHI